MGILSKLFGENNVPLNEFKTTHEFYAENYMGIPEIRTKFDGLWTCEVNINGRKGYKDAREVLKDEDKEAAKAKAQQWMQNKMRDDYQPEPEKD
jgi:hypothetical protein